MSKSKVSLFFGAGAEIGYGLPSGGRFALDLFRAPVDEDKAAFRRQLEGINRTSAYAARWLPADYSKKRLHVFGKADFEGMIMSSLEYRREAILAYLDRFDHQIEWLIGRLALDEETLRAKFRESTGEEIGQVLYGHEVKLNGRLAEQVGLFDSVYFSAMLKTLEISGNRRLRKIVRALLELLVGSCGHRLISTLNEELFESAPERLSVFDDLSGIFSLDYRTLGQTGLEIVLLDQPGEPGNAGDGDLPLAETMAGLGRAALEEIYTQALDYQALIDSHFRYLYNPKAQWAKFTRISIFLHTVRRYIASCGESAAERLETGPGYYHDLLPFSHHVDIEAVGTSNYNPFIQIVVRTSPLSELPVYHLNGSVDEFYDPYGNSVVSAPGETDWPETPGLSEWPERSGKSYGTSPGTSGGKGSYAEYPHLLVPFLFTQSGVKPLTSITMSRRYVELYDRFQASDLIIICGYGFNGDDGHINGMFRSLALEGKPLLILHYGEGKEASLRREYQEKLRLPSADMLEVLTVNDSRKHGSQLWWEAVLERRFPSPVGAR